MEASGDLARIIQRKIDYTFGGTFLSKVSKEQREAVEKALAKNGLVPEVELCPTTSKRVYFLSVSDKILFFMFLTLFAKLFDLSRQNWCRSRNHLNVRLLYLRPLGGEKI